MTYIFSRASQSIPDDESSYGYTPAEWIGVIFVVLYSITTLIHLGQVWYFRAWWLIPTAVFAGILEIIGWAGRLWSSQNVLLNTPFLMQIVCTIIAPTPLVAANFIILGKIIRRLGSRYSRLSAKWYTIVFLSCDIIALVVQAVGGAMASEATTNSGAATGGRVMLGGIIFQLIAIVFYVALASEFLFRYIKDSPIRSYEGARGKTDKRMKLLLLGMSIMTVFIFIRSIYRTIELADGWDGKIYTTQSLFTILDGLMITLAMFTLNIFHPGYLLPGPDEPVRTRSLESGERTPVDFTSKTGAEIKVVSSSSH
ncbi:RTA1-domain-containing protein [Artomyces pyxidatus]|uniref:RTA1-domain-containing protein n=1 Tax=Artomyces pyxidatus TaxID=48021 RepID=A0ACB8SZS7_9AGAM|nr:RTA1-domain-containing protein [Artomyces pyxidatus]